MTSQPEPGQMWPDDFGGGDGRLGQAQPVAGQPWQSESYQRELHQGAQYRPDPYQPELPEQYPAEQYPADQYPPDRELGGSEAPHPVPGLGGQRLRERQLGGPELGGPELGGRELGGQDLRVRQPRRRRSGARAAAFGVILSAGLIGLAVAAVGIAHQLLPRQFTPAQQRAISNWEMERRWLTLPAGKIFPATVSYAVPEQAPGTAQNLQLPASLLSIRADKSCAAAIANAVARFFTEHGCTAALQATYVDATGSMVATVAIAVLPDSAAAHAVVSDLASTGGGLVWDETSAKQMVHTLRVARTPAASFGDRQRQLSQALGAGPYVILSSAGFSDGRPWMRVRGDNYLEQEMIGFTTGLVRSAGRFLGAKPPAPACPGAPGC